MPQLAALTLLLAAVGLAGCASAPPASLTEWQGMELRAVRLVADGVDVPLPPERPLTLKMAADGKITGLSAINRYFGAFSRTNDGTILWQGTLGSTRIAGPPEAMKLETEYLRTLGSTSRLVVGAKVLTFKTVNGKNVIEFVRR